MFKQLALVSLAVALFAAGPGLACAQSNASGVASAASADRNKGNLGTPGVNGGAGSGSVGARGDKGTITKATRDKPGLLGEDGSLPKPNVRDDPQHRCLSPAGIC
jgi:hypothetical protein